MYRLFKRKCQKVSIFKGCLICDFMLKNGLFLSHSLGHFINIFKIKLNSNCEKSTKLLYFFENTLKINRKVQWGISLKMCNNREQNWCLKRNWYNFLMEIISQLFLTNLGFKFTITVNFITKYFSNLELQSFQDQGMFPSDLADVLS